MSGSGPVPTLLGLGLSVGLVVVLLAFVGVDPTTGITASRSPFTDEAWNVVNARNLVLLGTWSTDQFNLHLVNAPFSILEAGVFSVLGVGMAQARLVSILAVGFTTLVLAFGLRRSLGSWAALVAGAAFATCFLVLFYGRLAYTETLVMLEMTAAAGLIPASERPRAGRLGLVAGILFGLAIATKALAGFGIAGALVALAVVDGRRSAGMRRWLAGCVAGIGAIGLAWAVIAYLPNRAAVGTDLAIWAHQVAPESIVALIRRIGGYAFDSDGALPGLAPIGIGAAIGLGATVVEWRTMPLGRRRIAVAAVGWVALHLAVLLVSNYRPNRYLLPMLPGAILLLGVGAASIAERLRAAASGPGRPSRGPAAVMAAAIAVLVLPGIVAFGSWMADGTRRLEAMQRSVAALVPPGATVWGGYAPLVAMPARVTTIVPWPPAKANNGPAYTSRPVHWVVTGDHEPAWIVPSSPAWAARQERVCFEWGGAPVCLEELP